MLVVRYGEVHILPRGGLQKKNGKGILGVLCSCPTTYPCVFSFSLLAGWMFCAFLLMGLIQSRYGLTDVFMSLLFLCRYGNAFFLFFLSGMFI